MTRRLVDTCQASANMTDAKRRALGITIRKSPTRKAVPETYPVVEVREQRKNWVKVDLRDVELRTGRVRRPEGVSGAIVYYHLGDTQPVEQLDWKTWGTDSRTTLEISMPDSTPFGTTLWLAGAWLNTRLESGPIGEPTSLRLGTGVLQNVGS